MKARWYVQKNKIESVGRIRTSDMMAVALPPPVAASLNLSYCKNKINSLNKKQMEVKSLGYTSSQRLHQGTDVRHVLHHSPGGASVAGRGLDLSTQ